MDFTFDEKKIQLAMAQIASIHKGQTIFVDPDEDDLTIPRFELSLPSLNKLLSNHYYGPRSGFAMGKIYNFFGPESIGKSAMASFIAGELYRSGASIHWIDKENSWDNEYSKLVYGLDAQNPDNRLTVSRPDNAEQAFDTIQALVEHEAVNLIVLDSIAALGTADQNAKTAEEKSMAEIARKLSEHFPKIISKAGKSGISIIYINQLRANIQMGMAFGRTFGGGNAMHFFPHVALDFKKPKGSDIYKGDDYIGSDVEITATKNKTCRPKLYSNFMFYPGEGFSREVDILNLAIKVGVITKSGSWYNLVSVGKKIGNGLDQMRNKLVTNPELLNDIWEQTKALLDVPINMSTGEIIADE